MEGVNVLISNIYAPAGGQRATRMTPSSPPVMICVVSSLKQQEVTWKECGRVFTTSPLRLSQS